MQVWELIIASGIIGLVFSFGQQLTMWKLNRKAAKEDNAELHIEERIKALEAFQAAADGKATKLIVPSDMQNLAATVSAIKEISGEVTE